MKLFFFGPSGAGKSTIIHWLNSSLQYEVLQIDAYRAKYGDFTWKGFHRANERFIDDIGSGNQIIECSGTGKLGELIRHKIYKIRDEIHIMIIMARPTVCRSRNRTKPWYALKLPYKSTNDIHTMLKDQSKYRQLPWLYQPFHPLIFENNTSYDPRCDLERARCDLERIKRELSYHFL